MNTRVGGHDARVLFSDKDSETTRRFTSYSARTMVMMSFSWEGVSLFPLVEVSVELVGLILMIPLDESTR